MKTPEFWYQPRGWKSTMLAPLGELYRAAGLFRRALANPYSAPTPLIVVGNIVAGGAGKTPTAIAVAHLLQQRGAKPAFVTRGYGGKEKGPLQVDPNTHTARDVGDEALLLARIAPCWIGKDRVAAIQEAMISATHVILDDGLQNPSFIPTVSLLVIDGEVGFGNSRLIPAGPMRETLDDVLERTTAVVMIGEDKQNIASVIKEKEPLPIIKAHTQAYIRDDFPDTRPFLAFAGIARPEKFYSSCQSLGLRVAATKDFPDHYLYTEADLTALAEQAKEKNLQLLTTGKDWVRLPETYRSQVAVLPMEVVFENPSELSALI